MSHADWCGAAARWSGRTRDPSSGSARCIIWGIGATVALHGGACLLIEMVDAVLLEWEGVLADTAAARCDAMLSALREESVHFDPSNFVEYCDGLDVSAAAAAATV